MTASFATADLCDAHGAAVQVVEPLFGDFGGSRRFPGSIASCRVFEDNRIVRTTLERPREGRVPVVDGGGSLRCAPVGDQLGGLAVRNGGAGIVVWGAVRDSAVLATQAVGVKALGGNPCRSDRKGEGDCDVPVSFGGATLVPGARLYADEDGIVVAAVPLT